MFNNEDRAYTNMERATGLSIWMADAKESRKSHKYQTEAKE